MAAARGGVRSAPQLLSLSFNQDYSCISTGTRSGYSITNCEPFGKVYAKNEGASSIVEMLFCTSLVALVGAGDRPGSSPRRLQIVNTKRQSIICELTFPTTILAVKLNRRRLVVVLEEKIYVYDISNMKLLHEIETGLNTAAICALSPSSESSYLAYPSPLPSPLTPFAATPAAPTPPTTGDVILFDAISLSLTNIIQAHKAPLALLAINSTGTLLATASDKGTVIRIFALPSGERVHEFRRGSYPAKIYSISFNAVSTLLCVASDTETVHIFKLSRAKAASGNGARAGAPSLAADFEEGGVGVGRFAGREDDTERTNDVAGGGVTGSIRRHSLSLSRGFAGSVSSFLPSAISRVASGRGWEQPQRDFAFLKLPEKGVKSLVGVSSTTPQIMVITSEGLFYSYAIDLENGGECILQKIETLLDRTDDSGASV